jgi:hypothetical protein
MMLILKRRNLWDVVSGNEPTLNPIVHPCNYWAWLDKDQDALLQIVMTLKEGPHHSIGSFKVPLIFTIKFTIKSFSGPKLN